MNENYKKFIEDNFKIVNKQGQLAPLMLNEIQNNYLLFDYTGTDDILKARQEGLSTIIDAIFTVDFLLKENSYSVIIADIEENATGLLDRVKIFLESYESRNKIKIPLKYNSRFELRNEFMNSTFKLGTAKNIEFGRSKTIHNLHLSEFAFYNNINNIMAGAMQAVVEGGRKIVETTANGFNDYKIFRESDNGFKKIFFNADRFYSPEFLDKKRKELKERFVQEYPANEMEAFITSGQCFFSKDSLSEYLANTRNPIKSQFNVA